MKAILVKAGVHNIAGQWFAKQATAKVISIAPNLEAYYDVLGCQTIDIQERTIEGKAFDIICDDEAFLYEEPAVVSVRSKSDSRYNLVNSVIICRCENGEEVGLTDEECKLVLSHFRFNAINID